MLHGTIRNDDFKRNAALQCWNNDVTIQNNVATMLQRCVGLKIVVANRFVLHHFKRRFLKNSVWNNLSPGHNSLTELPILETTDDEYDYQNEISLNVFSRPLKI